MSPSQAHPPCVGESNTTPQCSVLTLDSPVRPGASFLGALRSPLAAQTWLSIGPSDPDGLQSLRWLLEGELHSLALSETAEALHVQLTLVGTKEKRVLWCQAGYQDGDIRDNLYSTLLGILFVGCLVNYEGMWGKKVASSFPWQPWLLETTFVYN